MPNVTFCFVLLRFGWIDEHFAVIPRSKALLNCGKNQTGLVTWRAPVTQKFDVFCFNESGMTFLYACLSSASHYTLIMHAMLNTALACCSLNKKKWLKVDTCQKVLTQRLFIAFTFRLNLDSTAFLVYSI